MGLPMVVGLATAGKWRWHAAVCLAVLAAGMALGQLRPIPNGPNANGPGTGSTKQVVPLVPVNEDLENYLTQADKLLAEGGRTASPRPCGSIRNCWSSRARRACQVSPGRFMSIAWAANQRIAALDAEGLKRYRELYDPQAQELYRQAQADVGRTALRRLVAQYFYTSYGQAVLDLLSELRV